MRQCSAARAEPPPLTARTLAMRENSPSTAFLRRASAKMVATGASAGRPFAAAQERAAAASTLTTATRAWCSESPWTKMAEPTRGDCGRRRRREQEREGEWRGMCGTSPRRPLPSSPTCAKRFSSFSGATYSPCASLKSAFLRSTMRRPPRSSQIAMSPEWIHLRSRGDERGGRGVDPPAQAHQQQGAGKRGEGRPWGVPRAKQALTLASRTGGLGRTLQRRAPPQSHPGS